MVFIISTIFSVLVEFLSTKLFFQFQNGDLYAKELPSSGLVSRLKGKYAPSSGHRMSVVTPPSSIETTLTPVKFRSKSTIDAPSIGKFLFSVQSCARENLFPMSNASVTMEDLQKTDM